VFLIAIKKINLKKRNFLKKYTYTEIVENSEIYVKKNIENSEEYEESREKFSLETA